MKYLLNQRGYALLIVMLTIIIFLSLSAVFMSSSLNHVTQERTVDTNNQAVTAAEMGLQKISKDIENQFKDLLPDLEIEYMKNINIINTNYLNEKVTLDASKKLLIDQNNLYYQDVTNLINGIIVNVKSEYPKPDPNSVNVDLKPKQIIENETKTYFYIKSLSPSVDVNDSFKITLEVNGIKVNEKNIAANINLDVPRAYFNDDDRLRYVKEPVAFNVSEFFETPDLNCLNLISMIDGDISKLEKPIKCILTESTTFANTKNFIEKMYGKGLTEKDFHLYIENFELALCNNNCSSNPFKNMSNTTLFILGDIPAKNINNSGGFQLYVNGIINLKNATNFGNPNIHTVMLGKSLEVKSLRAENSTFVLMGNDSKQGFYRGDNQKPKLELSANSKACINVDGFDSNSIENFKSIDGGKVYYYKNSTTSFNVSNKTNFIPVSSLSLLYETCNLTKFYSAKELGSLQFSDVKY